MKPGQTSQIYLGKRHCRHRNHTKCAGLGSEWNLWTGGRKYRRTMSSEQRTNLKETMMNENWDQLARDPNKKYLTVAQKGVMYRRHAPIQTSTSHPTWALIYCTTWAKILQDIVRFTYYPRIQPLLDFLYNSVKYDHPPTPSHATLST